LGANADDSVDIVATGYGAVPIADPVAFGSAAPRLICAEEKSALAGPEPLRDGAYCLFQIVVDVLLQIIPDSTKNKQLFW